MRVSERQQALVFAVVLLTAIAGLWDRSSRWKYSRSPHPSRTSRRVWRQSSSDGAHG